MGFNKYRIIKSCKNAWYIIEPTRQILLRDEEYNNLVKFESKEQALTYCKENNLEVNIDYSIEAKDSAVDIKDVTNVVEDNKNKMLECIDTLWVDSIELNKTGVKRLINSLCKNIIEDTEKRFNSKVEK